MVSKTVTVINAIGLHLRPAGIIVKELKQFPNCAVTLTSGGKTVKASSVMQIMSAAIKCGAEVEITAEGENEQAALEKVAELIESGFED